MSAVIFLDVDNTLLDNDRVKADLAAALERSLPGQRAARFWELYETARGDLGVVDYPETLRRFAADFPDSADAVAGIVGGVDFAAYLYPGALDAIAASWAFGTPVVLSDGDAVYQVAKIARAGIATAVRGNVEVVEHKERHLDELLDRYPADRYAMVDDKAGILGRMKGRLGDRLVTIHVRQGRYASEPPDGPGPDRIIMSIGALPEALREAFAVAAG